MKRAFLKKKNKCMDATQYILSRFSGLECIGVVYKDVLKKIFGNDFGFIELYKLPGDDGINNVGVIYPSGDCQVHLKSYHDFSLVKDHPSTPKNILFINRSKKEKTLINRINRKTLIKKEEIKKSIRRKLLKKCK